MLTPRQEAILRKVVESYAATGQPVASKTLAADAELASAPSTIRNELALLEEQGLLAHPHTSAGRLPTDAGHRYVVDRMLARPVGRAVTVPLALSPERRELDNALRTTTETLSAMTNLLAVASAPALERAMGPTTSVSDRAMVNCPRRPVISSAWRILGDTRQSMSVPDFSAIFLFALSRRAMTWLETNSTLLKLINSIGRSGIFAMRSVNSMLARSITCESVSVLLSKRAMVQ